MPTDANMDLVFFFCALYCVQAKPLLPPFTWFPFVERSDLLTKMKRAANLMISEMLSQTPSTANKKRHKLLCVDGGSGSGKTRLAFEFLQQVAQRSDVKTAGSLYVFMNLGNGSTPIFDEFSWGVDVFLGVRLASILLMGGIDRINFNRISEGLQGLTDADILKSFSLRAVLEDYASLTRDDANLPKSLLLHIDEVQYMLHHDKWRAHRDSSLESVARAMTRVLMEASFGRDVFFFPVLSGTMPIRSIGVFQPTEFSVAAITTTPLSLEGAFL
jgi:hypothetical protein